MDREQAMREAGCPACGTPLDRLVPLSDPGWPGSCAACGVRLYYLRPGQNPPPAFRTWDAARTWLLERRRTAHEWHLLRAAAAAESAGGPERAVIRCRRATLHDPPGWRICPTCRADEGCAFHVADALDQMPLPHADCSCHWPDGMEGVCVCEWTSEPAQVRPGDRVMG